MAIYGGCILFPPLQISDQTRLMNQLYPTLTHELDEPGLPFPTLTCKREFLYSYSEPFVMSFVWLSLLDDELFPNGPYYGSID